MLDAYIIDRIRRERAEKAGRDERHPLHKEQPPPEPTHRESETGDQERGESIINFEL